LDLQPSWRRYLQVKEVIMILGPDAESFLPPIAGLLGHPNRFTRGYAAYALSGFPSNAQVVPILLKALEDPASNVRVSAANALGDLRLEPASVVPALLRQLQDSDYEARAWSAIGLKRFGRKAEVALPALKALAQDTNALVRRMAFSAISVIERERSQQDKVHANEEPP
jgi:HEAT repeat protein